MKHSLLLACTLILLGNTLQATSRNGYTKRSGITTSPAAERFLEEELRSTYLDSKQTSNMYAEVKKSKKKNKKKPAIKNTNNKITLHIAGATNKQANKKTS